jgi:hypothetical protein
MSDQSQKPSNPSELPPTPQTPATAKPEVQHEAQFTGSGWKNPYVVYVILNAGLFLFLLLMAYLAWNNDWIPHR